MSKVFSAYSVNLNDYLRKVKFLRKPICGDALFYAVSHVCIHKKIRRFALRPAFLWVPPQPFSSIKTIAYHYLMYKKNVLGDVFGKRKPAAGQARKQ